MKFRLSQRLIGIAIQRARCLVHVGKLPDFLIVGVQKGGTTSLYYHLRQHSGIEMSPHFRGALRGERKGNEKEVHFFNDDAVWARGVHWYRSLFNNNGRLQGDASPGYAGSMRSCRRLHQVVPHAKLILILRDPVTRAFSAYNHIKQEKRVWGSSDYRLSFEEMIQREADAQFKQAGLVSRGFYMDKIEMLLKFYPRDQLLVLISERVQKQPQDAFDSIFDFLGVPRFQVGYQPDIHKRPYAEAMSEPAENRLAGIFKPFNERLFDFLGYRISEWERP